MRQNVLLQQGTCHRLPRQIDPVRGARRRVDLGCVLGGPGGGKSESRRGAVFRQRGFDKKQTARNGPHGERRDNRLIRRTQDAHGGVLPEVAEMERFLRQRDADGRACAVHQGEDRDCRLQRREDRVHFRDCGRCGVALRWRRGVGDPAYAEAVRGQRLPVSGIP